MINKDYEYAEMAAFANMQDKMLVVEDERLLIRDFNKSFDEEKIEKLLEINSTYERKALLIKIDTPESEILTWDIQKSEAEKFVENNQTATPFIDLLADSRQVDKLELIDRILAKVSAFNSYMATITGKRQYYEDRINNASTKEELQNIVWR